MSWQFLMGEDPLQIMNWLLWICFCDGSRGTDRRTENAADELRRLNMRVGLDLDDVVEYEVIVIRRRPKALVESIFLLRVLLICVYAFLILLSFLM